MIDPDILTYYELGMEQDRLKDPRRSIEYVRTMDVLLRHLPAAPATVLDVGGGPGLYALTLATLGYHVHLIDPVPLHIKQAQASSDAAEHPLASIMLGDARELTYADGCADAVLLLGPLYHLTSSSDRRRAWSEARRILRPGGTVVAAGASRYYTTWEMLSKGTLDLPGAVEAVQQHIATGQHRNPGCDFERLWTTAYFHDPDELGAEAAEAGLAVRTRLAVEGPAKLLPDLAVRMRQAGGAEQVVAAIRRMENEPSILGLSSHVLVIADNEGGRPTGRMNPDRTNALIRAISTWIDHSPANLGRNREALLWGRVAKVAEEAGEVIAALIGATSQNPRKGQSATRQDVEDELLDVAMTALAAVAHLHAADVEPPDLLRLLAQQVEAVARRAGLA